MRFTVGATLLAAVTLAGCTGHDGNPDGLPYANESGGVIAVKSQTIGKVSYDPYANPAPVGDTQAGQAAINPPPPMPPPPPRTR